MGSFSFEAEKSGLKISSSELLYLEKCGLICKPLTLSVGSPTKVEGGHKVGFSRYQLGN